ncbi:MAG: M28 family peptidase [Fuerstia sp.]|nr:M28 family peptidase [Fuerstiella sp.]
MESRLGRLVLIAWTLIVAAPRAQAVDGEFSTVTPVPTEYAAGFDSITESDSEQILRHLVEGEMAGRGTGQEGFIKAAKWFASQLEASGFQPAGENGSWFQNVPFIKLLVHADACGVKVNGEECIAGNSYGISSFAGTFENSIPVTFATLTNSPPEIADGQYAGRLLVVQAGRRFSAEDQFVLKAKPACLLIVADDGRVRNEAVNQSEQTPSAIPAALITRTAANSLAAKCGAAVDFFGAEDPTGNLILDSSQIADCRLSIERESIDVPNVVGWYPGTDDAVRHEHICIGAHLDHLGEQRGELYPGADDNGSGSTSLLQIAKAIHSNPLKPKRSVLMIAFCAEERGLLGSKHYASSPLRPLSDMICMLNIDMIGRNEESASEPASDNLNTIHLVGSKDHSQQLHQMVEKANESVGFVFEYDEEERVDGRSDHASFSEKGIPVTFLFGGFSPYYHKPTDTMDGINFAKITNAARLNYLVLMMASEHGRFQLDAKP